MNERRKHNLSNIKLPPDYASSIANRFNELEAKLISAYTPVLQNANISNCLAEQIQSLTSVYERNINPLMISDVLTANMSAYLRQIDFSEITNQFADLLTPDFSNIIDAYSQIDFPYLFDNLTITNESVELDEKSFDEIQNAIESLSEENDILTIEKSKSSKMTKKDFFLIVIYPLLLALLPMGIQTYQDSKNSAQFESFYSEALYQLQLINSSDENPSPDSEFHQSTQCPCCESQVPSESSQDTPAESENLSVGSSDDSIVQESEKQSD